MSRRRAEAGQKQRGGDRPCSGPQHLQSGLQHNGSRQTLESEGRGEEAEGTVEHCGMEVWRRVRNEEVKGVYRPAVGMGARIMAKQSPEL
jgi:hypothetical protein